jgi:hypothetical protein
MRCRRYYINFYTNHVRTTSPAASNLQAGVSGVQDQSRDQSMTTSNSQHQHILLRVLRDYYSDLSDSEKLKDEKKCNQLMQCILYDFGNSYSRAFGSTRGSKRAFCELLTTKEKFHQNLNWSNGKHTKTLTRWILMALREWMDISQTNEIQVKHSDLKSDIIEVSDPYTKSQILSCLELNLGIIDHSCIHLDLLDASIDEILKFREQMSQSDRITFFHIDTKEFEVEESSQSYAEVCLLLIERLFKEAPKEFNNSIIIDIDGKGSSEDINLVGKIASFPVVREIWVDKSSVFDDTENKIMAKAEGIMLTLRRMLYRRAHENLNVVMENTMLKRQLEDISTNWLRYFTRCDMNYVQTLVSLHALADFNPKLQLELEKLLCECDDPRLVCGIGYRYIDDDEMAICTKLEAEESKQ